jgi:hypothetical protein
MELGGSGILAESTFYTTFAAPIQTPSRTCRNLSWCPLKIRLECKADIVHSGDDHSLESSGTRLRPGEQFTTDMLIDTRKATTTAKCNLTILAPVVQYCEVVLSFSPYWRLGTVWPPQEPEEEPNKVKYFLRVHPGGALEHFDTEMVVTALYYEAM